MTKLWGGRFQKNTDNKMEDFTSSISFDKRLYFQDIKGSIAHAKMMAVKGIITEDEKDHIIKGLQEVLREIEEGKFEFKTELEDIHMNIEKRLTEIIGPVGGKLHTARSRNDQVSLDVHMYLKDEILNIQEKIRELQKAFINLAKENIYTIIPGYTHMQRAQPISFAHHLMAYVNMLERDYDRLQDCYKRTDMMPLGAGALAGTTHPIDRQITAKELGFSKIYDNSIDAVSDRDFIIEFLSACSVMMMHMSRLGEELVLWSTAEFSFIEMDDAFSTGSSIMPQKKNPDIVELLRGKSGRVYGNLMTLLTVMKSLPLAYNSDMQEDKESLFDTIDTINGCLNILPPMISTIKVKKDNMKKAASSSFSNATDAADYLVKKGMPFRESHEVIGKMVFYCIENKKELEDLTLEEYKSFSKLFEIDIYHVIDLNTCVEARNSQGGTGFNQVNIEIEKMKEKLQIK